MIQIFKRIRKNLVNEGKTTKYFKYAIGEVVLVVIGIFIALQLNTLKEERKQTAKTNVYIDNIINDIINDTLNINELLVIRREHMKGVDGYFKYFEEENHTIDELIDSVALTDSRSLFFYDPIVHAYEDMQSSGNSNLLGEAQRNALIELTNNQNFFGIIHENSVRDIKTAYREAQKYVDLDMSDSDFYEVLKINQNEKEKGLLHYHYVLGSSHQLARLFEREALKIKQKSNEAILILQEQKNK